MLFTTHPIVNGRMADLTIAIAGNPNSGKTTIFNALTGARQRVGNWPGVTVERKEGRLSYQNHSFQVIDLPGTYSLSSYSLEETIARNYIIDESPDVVLDIVDASNLQRNLYLSTQLIELGAPLVIALNMMDIAEEKGLEIDTKTLSVLLGVAIVPVVGRTGFGIDKLKAIINDVALKSPQRRRIQIPYPHEIEEEIQAISEELANRSIAEDRLRWKSIKLLERDDTSINKLKQIKNNETILNNIEDSIQHIETIYNDTSGAIISHARYGFIQGAIQECVRETKVTPRDYSRSIDKILTNRWLGLPVFALMMWIMFKITYDIGAYPTDWIDYGVTRLMNILNGMLPESMISSLLVDGVIGGVGAVAIFLPNIFILFFIITLFEDSGYMARVAFIMDRIMHAIGLHGKAFIPLLMGFGCNVPAIMGTRILETRRDRILTILLNPFMSCSARLPVYVLVAGAFFPTHAATVIFSLYLFGIVIAIASGKLFSKTILTGMSRPFVMELPQYQLPTVRSLLLHTWERGYVFIQKMGTVILVGSIIIWTLGYFPRNVTLSRDYSTEREEIRIWLEQKTVQIEQKFKESVTIGESQYTSTMIPFEKSESYQLLQSQRDSLRNSILYQYDEELTNLQYAEMAETMKQRWIGRVGRLLEPLVAPLGFTWREGVALFSGFVAKEIVVSTYGVLFGVGENVSEESRGVIESLRHSGMTPRVALGFLIFTLLYTPCLATVAAIKRETASWKYTIFSIGYSFTLAWLLAFIVFQLGSVFNWVS